MTEANHTVTEGMERRSFNIHASSSEMDRGIEGTVVRYGNKASIGGVFTEEFSVGSLRYDDVTLNAFHDPTYLLARTGGGGLDLVPRGHVLDFRAKLPSTTAGMDVHKLVRGKVLRGASVEMVVRDDTWDGHHRTIRSADLYGISLVARPAYSESEIAVMRGQLERMEAVRLSHDRDSFFERYVAGLRSLV